MASFIFICYLPSLNKFEYFQHLASLKALFSSRMGYRRNDCYIYYLFSWLHLDQNEKDNLPDGFQCEYALEEKSVI